MLTPWLHSTTLWLIVNTILLALITSFMLEFTNMGYEIKEQSDRIDVVDKLDAFTGRQANPDEQTNQNNQQNQNQQQNQNNQQNQKQHEKQESAEKDIVLLLGSSLSMYASSITDAKVFGEPALGSEAFSRYASFKYLDSKLEENSGPDTSGLNSNSSGSAVCNRRNFHTLNLSHPGCMISENLLLLQLALKAGIKPKMVFLWTAPRDFVDHLTNKFDQSKLAKVIIDRLSGRFWNFSRSATDNLESLTRTNLPLFAERDAVVKYFSTATMQTLATILHRPPYKPKSATIGGSFEFVKDSPGSPEMMAYCDANYKLRYLPLNEERYKQESEALTKIVALCRAENIPLLIVSMPLSAGNRNILPHSFIEKHRDMLARTAIATTNNGAGKQVLLLDLLEDEDFKADDYVDTVHLRSTGGIKLVDKIIAKVRSQGWLGAQTK